MHAYKTETTVEQDGSVTVRYLPFPAGERVEVIVLPMARSVETREVRSLQGANYRYDDPLEPVAEADWEAAQ